MASAAANRIMLELNKMDVEMEKTKQEVGDSWEFFQFHSCNKLEKVFLCA